ncbi:N-acyl homoserine lactonase family protein [Luteimonas sp. SJ-92]|uniref:N-acyl homoserine lactonase family protein n=1 Tax=Luteimonas salinisoli TaxID=2752307 RepID=A0A853JCM7_9GAMM|nr:N-acyl homoserine lactonase family protein [Luteimonas salinisoli]NZA26512.1 N-acyl homoserine lactonase family protein [Luteimonas salinisoli]
MFLRTAAFIAVFLATCIAPALATDPPATVRVYTLECGRIEFADLGMFSDTGEYDGQAGALAESCFLIRHPKGDLLWDAGLGDHFAATPGGAEVRPGVRAIVETPLLAQLERIGVTPADIEFLSFSHFHWDHTGNANAYTDATWLLSRRELEALEGSPLPPGVKPETLSGRKQAKVELLDLDHDVFGDGTVKILRAHGHTPGHQVLQLQLAQAGTVILSGDLFHTRENFEQNRMPDFNDSRGETLASMDRIKRILQNTSGRLVIQHEPRDIEAMPRIPAYLD